jgi:hypothetical protein
MLKMKAASKPAQLPKPKREPMMAIAIGFWDCFGDWTPNTPATMAKVALLALEREGYEVREKKR